MSKRDQEIARAMIEIASEYIGRDYDVRLGVSREESAQVLENWPPTDDTDETTNLVINNSMNEVCHAIRFPDGWPEHLLFSRDEAKDVFSLWLGNHSTLPPHIPNPRSLPNRATFASSPLRVPLPSTTHSLSLPVHSLHI
jgi:hypothetical protein